MSEEMTIAESQQAPEAPQEIANPADATAAEDTQGNQEQEEQTKEARVFTQEELDKIVQKRLAKERRNIEKYAQVEAENRMLRERLTPQHEAQDVGDGKPQPAQYQDYESYVEALSDWKVEQKLMSLQEQRQQQRMEMQREAQAEAAREKLSSAAEKYDDFEEVALNPKVPITTAMAQAITESDIGGDLAYYLGSHIDEAKRIATLSPVGQVRELAKLEAKLSQPIASSKAPKPISTVTGRKSSSNDLADDLPMDEWLKRRHTEIRNRYR